MTKIKKLPSIVQILLGSQIFLRSQIYDIAVNDTMYFVFLHNLTKNYFPHLYLALPKLKEKTLPLNNILELKNAPKKKCVRYNNALLYTKRVNFLGGVL